MEKHDAELLLHLLWGTKDMMLEIMGSGRTGITFSWPSKVERTYYKINSLCCWLAARIDGIPEEEEAED